MRLKDGDFHLIRKKFVMKLFGNENNFIWWIQKRKSEWNWMVIIFIDSRINMYLEENPWVMGRNIIKYALWFKNVVAFRGEEMNERIKTIKDKKIGRDLNKHELGEN